MTFSEGNTFNELQLNSRAQVVVLDSNTRRQLFPHKARVVGEVILVGNMPATVIGVADEKQSMFGSSKILRVWLPYTTMAGRVMGQSWLNSITVRVNEGYDSAPPNSSCCVCWSCAMVKRCFHLEYGQHLENGGKDHTYITAVPDAGGGDCAGGRRDWRDEYYAGVGDRTNAGDRHPHGGRGAGQRCAAAVSD
jgi:macrolide transport system ATP-binding/permease protein